MWRCKSNDILTDFSTHDWTGVQIANALWGYELALSTRKIARPEGPCIKLLCSTNINSTHFLITRMFHLVISSKFSSYRQAIPHTKDTARIANLLKTPVCLAVTEWNCVQWLRTNELKRVCITKLNSVTVDLSSPLALPMCSNPSKRSWHYCFEPSKSQVLTSL
jgi:hypothetical protein